MKKVCFKQIYEEDKLLARIGYDLWLKYNQELDYHDGKTTNEEETLQDFERRIKIQRMRTSMHFEVIFKGNSPIGLCNYAIDLGGIKGMIEPGFGYIMEFYISEGYRQKGYGREMYLHISEILLKDGATNIYLTPDQITGKPFWEKLGFTDSGITDPDNHLSIYTKQLV